MSSRGPINGTSPSLFDQPPDQPLSKTCAVPRSEDRARLTEATAQLRSEGIPNADKLARLAAAAVIEHSLSAWRTRGTGKLGELAQMVVQGGPSAADVGYVSERQRVVASMNWWTELYG